MLKWVCPKLWTVWSSISAIIFHFLFSAHCSCFHERIYYRYLSCYSLKCALGKAHLCLTLFTSTPAFQSASRMEIDLLDLFTQYKQTNHWYKISQRESARVCWLSVWYVCPSVGIILHRISVVVDKTFKF